MTGFRSSCGACKFLRRKCNSECVFAPYFCYEHAAKHFAAVHRVFGASNVSKLLQHLPVQNRSDAAQTVAYEALARMRDPIHGCVAHIFALQQQVANLQEEIEALSSQNANLPVGIPDYQIPQYDTEDTLCHLKQEVASSTHPEYVRNQSLPVAPQYMQEDQNTFCNFAPPQMDFEGAEPGSLETDSYYAAWEGISW